MTRLLVAVLALAGCAAEAQSERAPAIAIEGGVPAAFDDGGDEEPRPVLTPHDGARIAVHEDDPTWGDHDAPATFVHFADFQCPHCGRLAATLVTMREHHGPAKVRVVWKDFPLAMHQSHAAHAAGRAVFQLGGSNAFWVFHDLVFSVERADLPHAPLAQWAQTAGVSGAAFEALRAQDEVRARVDANAAEGRSYGVRGTPTLFINGARYAGPRTLEAFSAAIEAQVAAANELVESGVPRDRVYIELCERNYTP